MKESLEYEEAMKSLVHLMFAPHDLNDISSLLSERKSGTDFILTPYGQVPLTHGIRGENKFEKYTSGRVTVEFVSVDRAGRMLAEIVPGWFFTSRAAWLLSWFRSGELLVCNMDELRRDQLSMTTVKAGTSTFNKGYLSWNRLPGINEMLDRLPSARWVDTYYETGLPPQWPYRMIHPRHAGRQMNADQLVHFMSGFARESTPLTVSQEQLKDYVRAIALVDLKKEANARMREKLSWLSEAPVLSCQQAKPMLLRQPVASI